MTALKKPSAPLLSGLLSTLVAVVATLPVVRCKVGPRVNLGPHLPPRARELTDEVALILRLRPAEFSDYPTAAEEIDADQQAADGYLELHHYFKYQAEVCLASYQHHQAQAVVRSREILRTVLAGFRHPRLAPHLRHQRRVSLLTPALTIFLGRKTRGQTKVKTPATATPATAMPATATATKARRASIARRKERLEALFGAGPPTP